MTNRVNFFAPLGGNIGYAAHGRGLARGMDEAGLDVRLFASDWMNRPEISHPRLVEMLKKTDDADLSDPAVCLTIPRPEFAIQFGGRPRILLTVYELSKIPNEWVPVLSAMDDIWTVSHWGKRIFEECGVKHDVKVVPEGVDTVLFSPEKRNDHAWSEVDDGFDSSFKFLFLGKWEKRKNVGMLMRAFQDEFKEGEDCRLILACDNPFIKGFSAGVAAWEAGVRFDHRFIWFHNAMSDEYLATLYANCDAFVMPTSGEGWCLPLMEAMASGLPCLSSTVGGQEEYLRDGLFYPIYHEGFEAENDGIFFDGTVGEWAIISEASLRREMRYVYDNQDEARKMGARAAAEMHEKWSWRNAGERAKGALSKW